MVQFLLAILLPSYNREEPMMKLISIIFLVLTFILTLSADEIPIRKADDLWLEPFIIETGDGSQMVFWSDLSSGNKDVYCQKIGLDGQTCFPEAIAVISAVGDQELVDVEAASDGNFFLLWVEKEIQVFNDVKIQKVSASGNSLWAEDVVISYEMEYSLSAQLLADTQGGAYVVYLQPSSNAIMGQHLDYLGNRTWLEGDISLLVDPYLLDLDGVVPVDTGGFIINVRVGVSSTWQNRLYRFSETGSMVGSGNFVPYSNFPDHQYQILPPVDGQYVLYQPTKSWVRILYVNKIDAEGNLAHQLCTMFFLEGGGHHSDFLSITNTADAGVLIAWESTYEDDSKELKVQKLADDLEPDWANVTIVYNSQLSSSKFRQYALSDGKIMLSWVTGSEDPCLRAQLLDSTGNALWGTEAKLISEQATTFVASKAGGNYIFLWDYLDTGYKRINYQSLDASGNEMFPENGINLEQRLNLYCYGPDNYVLGDKFISLWTDFREGSSLYYQIYNQNMDPLLEPQGRRVFPEAVVYSQILDATVTQDEKFAFVYRTQAYNDDTNYEETYLQTIDSSGQTGFPGLGMDLVNGINYQMSSVDNALYLAWKTVGSNIIRAQKIVNNQAMWNIGGKLIYSAESGHSTSLCEMAGSYIVFSDFDLNLYTQTSKVLRIDANGDPAVGWNHSGTCVFSPQPGVNNYCMDAGLVSDALVVFGALNDTSSQVTRVQKISSTGVRLWGDQGVSFSENDKMVYIESVVYDEPLSFLYYDSNNIVLHRLNSDGEELGSPYGIVLIPQPNHCYDATLHKYEDGSMISVYSDDDGVLIQNRDLYYRMIDIEGCPVGEAPSFLCAQRYQQEYPSVAIYENKAFVGWNDSRAGIYDSEETYSGIWAKVILSASNDVDDPHTIPPAGHVINCNYPNPFNPSTTISFSLTHAAVVDLNVYNLKGQIVSRILSGERLEQGNHNALWDGKDDKGNPVSSGIYFCLLSSDGKASVRKMLMAK